MSDDIKQRLLDESFKGQEAMRREALARIEALEVQVERLKTPAKECYHEEGCPQWVEVVTRNAALRAQLAAAREALMLFADPSAWRLGGSCDPNSGAFRGQEIAQHTLAALGKTTQ